jgi:hypothetical protein
MGYRPAEIEAVARLAGAHRVEFRALLDDLADAAVARPRTRPAPSAQALDLWAVELEASWRLIEAHPGEFDALLDDLEGKAPAACPVCDALHLSRWEAELAGRLGHDRQGHRAASDLRAGGYRTVKQVQAATDDALRALRGIGDGSVEWVRYALGVHDLVHARRAASKS